MVVPPRRQPTAALALQDGTVFLGFGLGSPGVHAALLDVLRRYPALTA